MFGLHHFISLLKNELDSMNYRMADVYMDLVKESTGVDLNPKDYYRLLTISGIPLEIKGFEEGELVPVGIPLITVQNTNTSFFWLTNFIETWMSSEIWKCINNATIAYEYKKLFTYYAMQTCDTIDHVDFQGHDFSFRGMSGADDAILSGLAHLTCFKGTDTLPAIYYGKVLYGKDVTGYSIPATEHSVMSAYGEDNELETFRHLINDVYPSGLVSIVSDTWDFWRVMNDYLSILKDDILKREGKVVFRPDSGNPADIVCGTATEIGAIEALANVFGFSTNSKGYKELNPKVGLIYGDGITIKTVIDILERLKAKGWASNNIVFGIGSYTYQYSTRDSFSFAMKSTYTERDGKGYEIFKSPKTGQYKKSARGLIRVDKNDNGEFTFTDRVSRGEELKTYLTTYLSKYGIQYDHSFTSIRDKINENIQKELSNAGKDSNI
jgi:nicotinamide phosphoribosyltransferase